MQEIQTLEVLKTLEVHGCSVLAHQCLNCWFHHGFTMGSKVSIIEKRRDPLVNGGKDTRWRRNFGWNSSGEATIVCTEACLCAPLCTLVWSLPGGLTICNKAFRPNILKWRGWARRRRRRRSSSSSSSSSSSNSSSSSSSRRWWWWWWWDLCTVPPHSCWGQEVKPHWRKLAKMLKEHRSWGCFFSKETKHYLTSVF